MKKQLFTAGLKESLHFKYNFLLSLVEKVVRLFIMYFFFRAILPPSLFEKTFIYLVIALLLESATHIEMLEILAQKIEKGEMIYWLIRPYEILKVLICYAFGKNVVNTAISVYFLLLICNYKLYPAINISAFCLALIFSFFINSLLQYLYGTIIFYTVNSWGVKMFYKASFLLLSGSLLPIFLLPSEVQNIYYYLPFYYCIGSPIAVLTNQNCFYELIYQFVFLVSIYLLIHFLNKKAVPESLAIGG